MHKQEAQAAKAAQASRGERKSSREESSLNLNLFCSRVILPHTTHTHMHTHIHIQSIVGYAVKTDFGCRNGNIYAI